jgi:hypothetical protein
MTTGADLLILAVDEQRGTVRAPSQLGFALAAAELVDLASARRIEVVDGQIHVVERLRLGDPVLDAALSRLEADPEGTTLDGWIGLRAPNRVAVHISALLESGELTGTLVRLSVDTPPRPSGLRVANAGRRRALVERLTDAARPGIELEDKAFGALAYSALLPDALLSGLRKGRTAKRLKELAGWFTDTWRYLPGCPEELALGDADVEPGGVNPAHDEPWRLSVRLAVQVAVTRAEEITRKDEGTGRLSKDVQNAWLLEMTLDNNL